jgi:hypothetical protein
VNIYPFIEAEKACRRNVKRACPLLKVSRSTSSSERAGDEPGARVIPSGRLPGAEQSGFEYFLRIECQAVQSADEDGLVVELASLQTRVGRPTGHCLRRGPGS